MKLISKEKILKYSRTPGMRNEIDEILEPVLLAQRIYGLQILDSEWSWKKYGIYRIASFIFCIYISIGTYDACSRTTDLNLIIEGIFTLFINIQMLSKILLFVGQRKNFQKIYVKSKTYIYSLIKEFPAKRMRIMRNMKLLVKSLAFITAFPIFCYLLVALWFGFNGNRVTLSRSTSTLMPMTSPYYELGLLIQLFYLTEAAFCLLVIDFWFIFKCVFFFEASELSMEILEVKKNKSSADLYAKQLDYSLRQFYVLHVEIMEFLSLLNDMYKWISLIPFTAILINTSLFLMLLKEELSLQICSVMLPATAEIMTYNWYGDRITSKTDKINMALLHFDWTSMHLKDQKKYYIIACYMNKTFSVKTAMGYDLSLLTLSSIYKASYQIFTVFSTT